MTDYHVHTDLSDGKCSLSEVLEIEKESGIRQVVITDHFDPGAFNHLKVAFSDYLKALDQAALRWKEDGITVCKGVEVTIDDAGLPLGESDLDELDLVIGSVHRIDIGRNVDDWLDSEYWGEHKRLVLKGLETPRVDVIGHIEGYLSFPPEEVMPDDLLHLEAAAKVARTHFDRDFYREVAERARRNDVGVEIHCATRTPRLEVIRFLVDHGVKLSIGSDGHNRREVANTGYALEVINKLNLHSDHFIASP